MCAQISCVKFTLKLIRHWHSGDRASWCILVMKPTRCTNSQIYFRNKTLHVSDSPSVRHQEFFTVHTAMVYVWHIPLLCVQWKTPDDGQRNCPKHGEFYSKNKFENSASSWFYYKNYSDMFQCNFDINFILLICAQVGIIIINMN